MNSFDDQINKVINDMTNPANLDNPNWLSEAIIQLAALNYRIGVEMARRELAEHQVITNLLAVPTSDGEKKMSVAEAEKRGLTETENAYGTLKNQSFAVIELIQAIKKRIEVLSFEHRNG